MKAQTRNLEIVMKDEEEQVILVDSDDNQVGVMNKLEAHEKALLHRAFSVFVFNSKGEMLMQQRALSKYHSRGLWTNTCCSHPRQNEETLDAANRRLQEEMGMQAVLKHQFHFIYRAPLEDGLWEHELDHVFFGTSDDEPQINREEVESWKYMKVAELDEDMKYHPERYTAWFKIIFERVRETL